MEQSTSNVPPKAKGRETDPFAALDEVFDCDEIHVFRVKRNNRVNKYCIIKMGGDSRDLYMTALASKAKVTEDPNDPNKKHIEMTSMEGTSTMLLKHCIAKYDEENHCAGELVPEAELKKWPTELLDKLNEAANDFNVLNPKKEQLGNDSTSPSVSFGLKSGSTSDAVLGKPEDA